MRGATWGAASLSSASRVVQCWQHGRQTGGMASQFGRSWSARSVHVQCGTHATEGAPSLRREGGRRREHAPRVQQATAAPARSTGAQHADASAPARHTRIIMSAEWSHGRGSPPRPSLPCCQVAAAAACTACARARGLSCGPAPALAHHACKFARSAQRSGRSRAVQRAGSSASAALAVPGPLPAARATLARRRRHSRPPRGRQHAGHAPGWLAPPRRRAARTARSRSGCT